MFGSQKNGSTWQPISGGAFHSNENTMATRQVHPGSKNGSKHLWMVLSGTTMYCLHGWMNSKTTSNNVTLLFTRHFLHLLSAVVPFLTKVLQGSWVNPRVLKKHGVTILRVWKKTESERENQIYSTSSTLFIPASEKPRADDSRCGFCPNVGSTRFHRIIIIPVCI